MAVIVGDDEIEFRADGLFSVNIGQIAEQDERSVGHRREINVNIGHGIARGDDDIDAIGRNAPLADPELCYRDVLERDAIVSTYQDNGIAMPHARTDGTSSFATAIGISADGIDYDEGADPRVRIVILSVCPKDEPGPYLQFIARIARVLTDGKRREAILSARDAAEAARVFTGA